MSVDAQFRACTRHACRLAWEQRPRPRQTLRLQPHPSCTSAPTVFSHRQCAGLAVMATTVHKRPLSAPPASRPLDLPDKLPGCSARSGAQARHRAAAQSFINQDASQPASSPTTLARGTACLPCRRRKMRCDGQKPVCGPCIAKDRREDCEYTGDIQGLTRTQLLEENITLLEARIRELENPSESSSIKLRDVPGSSGAPLNLIEPSFSSAEPVVNTPSFNLRANSPEPSARDILAMINAFIPNAPQLGFFLNISRLVQLAQLPAGSRDALSEPLVSAACLWGSHLARGTPLAAHEERLLARAVQGVAAALFLAGSGGARGHGVLGVVQAEVLLAHYFFAAGRLLEGRYHSSAAASLAITCRLNAAGRAPLAGLGMGLVHGAQGALAAPPADPVEQGERINAFWAVYVLDKCWSAALGSPSAIADNESSATRISTPWPLAMAQYVQGQAPPYTGLPVVSQFLNGHLSGSLEYFSPLALRAQASTLFSQASALASRYHDEIPEKSLFWHEFSALNSLIHDFLHRFPQTTVGTQGDSLELLVARAVAQVAVIQLHIRFTTEQAASRDACLAAANAVLASVQDLTPEVGYIDPIMAILLSIVCQVYLGEINAFGAAYDDEYLAGVRASLDRVLGVMRRLGEVCPLMAIQMNQVREAQAAQ